MINSHAATNRCSSDSRCVVYRYRLSVTIVHSIANKIITRLRDWRGAVALEPPCTSTLGHRHAVRLATGGDLRRSTSEKHECSTGITYAARVLPEQLEGRKGDSQMVRERTKPARSEKSRTKENRKKDE